MANLSRKLLFIIFTLSHNIFTTQGYLTCDKINSCSCKLSNGEVVDLSPLMYTKMVAAGENSEFHLFMCNPRDYGDDTSTCNKENDVVICQDLSVAEGIHIYYNWGRQYTAEFSVSNPYPLQIEILYRFGDSDRNTTVNVRCDESTVATLSLLGVYNRHAEFALHTKYGCPGYREASATVPVLLILVLLGLTAFGLYFIIGAIVNWQIKGAKGTEAIPNFVFWKETPLLFLDGFYLVGAPICQCARDNLSKRSASYAQI
ncbi:hypothetical protein LOD99_6541 [Oopsacas minuta]|uniref:Autophagy-related protein 27 n=1 Tax=Oopsacas minuta TaxID=111878 RepID=A0AAV7JLT0_9METZ|nr:hypothetical protein LOD99_6541 [Oopsacas minuta]